MAPVVLQLDIMLLLVLAAVGIGVAIWIAMLTLRRPRLGHPTLNCPHCGVETRVDRQKCSACNADL